MKFWIAAFILVGLPCSKSFSQNKSRIGLDIQLGYQPKYIRYLEYEAIKTYQASMLSSFGIVYERLLSNNFIIEMEIVYQIAPTKFSFYIPAAPNSTFQVNVFGKESFLSAPILLKYNTNILNVSLGPTFDYFIGWSLTSSNYYISSGQNSLPKWFFPDKWSMGFLFKISKSIHIGDKSTLEPGIFYNPILSYKNNYFGISIIVKYSF